MRAQGDGLADQPRGPLVVSLPMGGDAEQVERPRVFRVKVDQPAVEGNCPLETPRMVTSDRGGEGLGKGGPSQGRSP